MISMFFIYIVFGLAWFIFRAGSVIYNHGDKLDKEITGPLEVIKTFLIIVLLWPIFVNQYFLG